LSALDTLLVSPHLASYTNSYIKEKTRLDQHHHRQDPIVNDVSITKSDTRKESDLKNRISKGMSVLNVNMPERDLDPEELDLEQEEEDAFGTCSVILFLLLSVN